MQAIKFAVLFVRRIPTKSSIQMGGKAGTTLKKKKKEATSFSTVLATRNHSIMKLWVVWFSKLV